MFAGRDRFQKGIGVLAVSCVDADRFDLRVCEDRISGVEPLGAELLQNGRYGSLSIPPGPPSFLIWQQCLDLLQRQPRGRFRIPFEHLAVVVERLELHRAEPPEPKLL